MSESRMPSKSCPQCGVPVPQESIEGLCPRCLMAEAMIPTADNGPASSMPAPTVVELAPHFPQLDIQSLLGRGGMGVVYKARQRSLNRWVALKLLAPERVQDERFARRFMAEARALAALNHPNIVTVHDFGQAGGFYFLLMEFVDGVNLRQAMKTGRFTPDQALAVVPPVCTALQYAHDHGIVHRDIKPENLLLDKEGRVKIADFGIATMLNAGEAGHGEAESQPPGTPQYMAPEQTASRAVDHRADVYSMGVVLYELLTGELPSKNLVPPSKRVQVDVRLDEIVLRALEVQPELRFATAAEFRTQVESVGERLGVGRTVGRSEQSAPDRFPTLTIRSTLTTHEDVRTASGQLGLAATVGQLLLDDRQLLHSRSDQMTRIPLESIRELGIGQYPWWLNPLSLNFISLGYEQDGKIRRILLSPMLRMVGLPWNFNSMVSEWHAAIRERVRAVQGREPQVPRPEHLTVQSGFPLVPLLVGLPLLMTYVTMFGLLAWFRRPTSGPGVATLPGGLDPIVLGIGSALLSGLAFSIGAVLWVKRRNALAPTALSTLGQGASSPYSVKRWRPWIMVLVNLTWIVLLVLIRMQSNRAPSLASPTVRKELKLQTFTNQNDWISVSAPVLLGPGESLRAWLVHSDGTPAEPGNSLESIFGDAGREKGLCTWSWRLPDRIGVERTDEVVGQMLAAWEGRVLSLTAGLPFSLFVATNQAGVRVSGELRLERSVPKPGSVAVAEVRMRNHLGGLGGPLLFLNIQTPPGHSLHTLSAGTEVGSSHWVWSRSSGRYMDEVQGSWFWLDPGWDPKAVGPQIDQLFQQQPLRVTNGFPRTLFSVTNAQGRVYRAELELR